MSEPRRLAERHDPLRSAGLVLALGVAWGLNWSAVRVALDEIPPWTMRAAGLAGGAALIFGWLLVRGGSPGVPRRHWVVLAVVGLLSVAGFNVLSALAQLSGPSSRAIILAYTMPVWAVLLARLVVGEPLDGRRRVGLALGMLGLAVLGIPLARSGELNAGMPLALGAGMAWAAGSVVLKRWPIPCSPLVITAWQLALSAVLVGTGALVFEGWPHGLPTRPETWMGFAYNLVMGQAVATTLWFAMLEFMPAGIASIASLLVPAIGVAGTTIILGERPTAADWLGLALIVAASASVLLQRSDPPERLARNASPRGFDPGSGLGYGVEMSDILTVDLPPDTAELVADALRSGDFPDASAVVRAAVHLLHSQRGDVSDLSADELRLLGDDGEASGPSDRTFDDVKREIMHRANSRAHG